MEKVKGITSMMGETRVFPPSKEFSKVAHIGSFDEYRRIYQESIQNPERFWGELAEQLDWFRKWDKVLVEDFKDAEHKWFVGGKLNVCYNCLDRHLKTWRKNKAPIFLLPILRRWPWPWGWWSLAGWSLPDWSVPPELI